MMRRSDNFQALPEEVIAFAWSAPMRELAARVGISDVGLKKLLRSQGIPTPPQGYWNRVHAGRQAAAPPEPDARRAGGSGRVVLDQRFEGIISKAGPMAEEGPFASADVPEDLAELREQELDAIGKAAAPRDLSKPAAGLRKLLRAEAARREKAATSRWHWDEPHFDTPLGKRKLRIISGLFRTLERRGGECDAWDDNQELRGRCTIGDETLRLRFEIIGKHRTELRSGYHRPARDLPASTPIRLKIDRSLRGELITDWSDGPNAPIEKQLASIAADLIVAPEASFRQGLVEARERREEQQRWEDERRRERLRELEIKRIADLKKSGELLRQAEEIRSLVARTEAAMLADSSLEITPEKVALWKRWALSQADQIDPVLSGQVLDHLHVAALDDDG